MSATLHAIDLPGAIAAAPPLVLAAGRLEPKLTCIDFIARAPLDERTATLLAAPSTTQADRARWLTETVTIVQRHAFTDGSHIDHTLIRGRLQQLDRQQHHPQRQQFIITDQLTERLRHPLKRVFTTTGTMLHEASPTSAAFRIGESANRSKQTFTFNGRTVHILQPRGEAWTLAAALDTLASFAGLALHLDDLPETTAGAPLLHDLPLDRPLEDLLRRLLEPHDLRLQRTGTTGTSQSTQLVIRSPRASPRHRLGQSSHTRPLQLTTREDPAPVRLELSAPGWTLESTFDLVPGWNPADESQDASRFRFDHEEFPALANVHRRWVLNEDGFFTPPPYNRGEAFNLETFFSQSPIPPQPLRFGSCLVRESDATRRPPVVQVSLDAGQTWLPHRGRVLSLNNRAGIYLNDDVLDADFLAASMSGQARLRLTATLQSPLDITAAAPIGNPFLAPARTQSLGRSAAFRFQRVLPASIHRQAIDWGILIADEQDDTHALDRHLQNRAASHRAAGTAQRSASATFPGDLTTVLNPGDRLLSLGDFGFDHQLPPRGACIQAIHVRYPSPTPANLKSRDHTTTVSLLY